MVMKRIWLLLFLTCSTGLTHLRAQPEAYFVHYGPEKGLPQHTITDILQDRNGFMWFSTWDGLSKFDGYTFTNYHLPVSSTVESRSSRIDNLFEDKYNNIWTLSYDNQAFRFNIETESFVGTNAIEEFRESSFVASAIVPMERGNVWLLSKKQGCIVITDSLFNARVYNTKAQNLTGDHVYAIHEDTRGNTWILTDRGLTRLAHEGEAPLFYFNKRALNRLKEKAPFFSVLEVRDEVWFGSSQGMVWRYSHDSEQFSQFPTGMGADIISIKPISSEKILLASKQDGFAIFNTYDESLDRYNPNDYPEMGFRKIMNTYVDRSSNVWLETDQLGVSKFNPYTEEYIHFTPLIESTASSVFPPKYFIFEDKRNRLWVHPRGGGFSIYDRATDSLLPFYNEPFSSEWLFSNMMHAAYSDRQGNLWMCTRSHGLEKVIFYDDSKFRAIQLYSNVRSTISNDVRPIYQDSSGNIWAGTKDGKIHVSDIELNKLGVLSQTGLIGEGDPLNGIAYCITEDSEKNIWIGTKGEGIYRLKRNGRDAAFSISHYRHDPGDNYSLSDDNVYSIFEDKNKNIWIGTFGGGINLLQYVEGEARFIHSRNELVNYPLEQGDRARVISQDHRGNICVGTTLGFIFFHADFESPKTIEFQMYTRDDSDTGSIGANDIMDIFTTSAGETFIGTFGGGISKIEKVDARGYPVTFTTYNNVQGLPSNIILSIQEDGRGDLWIGSEGGLTKFNRSKETFENFSEVKRLMKRYNFSENSRYCLKDGRILFGYSNGLLVFDPERVENNTYNPYLALVQFKLFNRDVAISPKGPLTKNINLMEELELRHNQNFITIEFAALDYVDPDNILYSYKLDGFDKEWVYAGNQRVANYTNLSRGKYLFRVKSTNSDGVWTSNERLLAIEVLPPFWSTTWAYLIYILIALLIFYSVFRILYAFYKMRNKIVLEKQESEMKTRFFTNISHEIRTPLTMIVSPIENLLQNPSTPEPVQKQLKLVSKNTNRLLNMVNQILDFQKIEHTSLTVAKIELVPFVESIYTSYAENALLRKIDYQFENRAGNPIIWADPEAVEKMVMNLLSNAFKYTHSGQSIHLALLDENGYVGIQVRDSGIGISREKQERLFRRFESYNEDKSKPSTGIGLSIVKELAEKHQARIVVNSEEKKGSCFTVFFKKGVDHFGSNVAIRDTLHVSPPFEQSEFHESTRVQVQDDESSHDYPTVLVVEDDQDLRGFIRSILEDEYEVHEASNGSEGYDMAVRLIPDFIISDIMMPEVDGMELLEKVRKNPHTSHILFLLLTAKTTLDSQLEGFECGADEYITKPFSVSYFKARVKNLLQRRSELQELYRNRNSSTSLVPFELLGIQEASVNEKDMEFIQTVNRFIEEHMGSNDFVIEDMAIEVGMSRTVFFKKLKGLTGLAPVEYVRDVLMQYAAEFLLTHEGTIKEVSYMVGMNDTRYFTKCFKKKYNMTPSEYRKKYKHQEVREEN